MRFFKVVLASAVGYILASIIIIGISIAIVIGIASSVDTEVEIKEHSVLHMKLNYPLQDRVLEEGPFAALGSLDPNVPAAVGLNDLLRSVDAAAEDDRIDGIILDLSVVGAGYGKLMEVRNKLESFKESGKFIYAYADAYDHKSYYLASVADSVFVSPLGNFFFNGMRAEVTFLTNTLKKLGVEMQAVRAGKYKGAVESLTRNDLSPENREQIRELVFGTFEQSLAQMAGSRGISVEQMKADADLVTSSSLEDYVNKGYLDGITYRDEFYSMMKKRMGVADDRKVDLLSLFKYNKTVVPEGLTRDRVAVVYAQGDIIPGKGEGTEIAAEDLSRTLRKLKENSKVKAVVLRINSGGGSALASEQILREAKLLAEEKPLIVSMSDVAASGGYYIAMAGHKIVADPTTITGSIGVFTLFPNAQEMLNDKLGIHMEYIGTNKNSDLGRIDQPMSEDLRAFLQMYVDETYETFKERVAEGRQLSLAEVDSIAQGRVWSGAKAKEVGLVDELGGLEMAIEMAASEAGLETYRVKDYPQLENPFSIMVKRLQGETSLRGQLKGTSLEPYVDYLLESGVDGSHRSMQMRIPYKLELTSYGLN